MVSIDDVDTGPCPRGGCWERLLTLLDMRADAYVIQLDSDTIALGDIPEVVEAITSNRSFTLLGDPDSEFLSFSEMASLLDRSEENTSELQSLMRISYASLC